MYSGTKRARASEPLELPGTFPRHSRKAPRRETGEWIVTEKGDGGGTGGEWLVSYILSPLRLAKNWLVGSSSEVPETPTQGQRKGSRDMSARQRRRRRTRERVQQANNVHGSHHTRRHVGSTPRPRKSLLGTGARDSARKNRNSSLVREYTMPSQWSAGAALSSVADTGYDTRSILSVDSSLQFGDDDSLQAASVQQSPWLERSRTPSVLGTPTPVSRVGLPLQAKQPARNTSIGVADAWYARLRKKIEDTLAVPAMSKVATPAYDRIRGEEESFDKRLAKAREQLMFSLPADATQVIRKARQAGFTVELNNVPVCTRDISTLGDGQWLNDEVINFYMQLIMSRAQTTPALPKVHCFNTFFYSWLKESGYAKVRRWTRRVKLFEKDLVIVPVHLGVHWCCAVVDFRSKQISYYDALHGDNQECLETLMDYLCEESKDKLKQEFDTQGWVLACDKQIPRQGNGYDCGLFAIMFAEHCSRDAPFAFSQSQCPLLRHRVIYEIATKSLLATIA
ncbi:hypothetical protein GGF46_005463 [Coemansia sp. RSA 552]|nr:hypothetical protein GGF46_005463 [Coemansia sp. RSA 552]